MNLILETIQLSWLVLCGLVEAFISWFVPKEYKSVQGEVCLVTGAGSGIGRLLALDFAKRGAKLVLWDINADGKVYVFMFLFILQWSFKDNNKTKNMIEDIGGKAFADTCDLSKPEAVYEAAERAILPFGGITILVNNAGIVFGKRLMDLKDSQIEATMKVNSLAHFWTYKAFLPSMLEKNHGHIVNISSTLGLFALEACPDYVASKFASFGFSMAMKFDIDRQKKHGVVSTVVCPYVIHTGMFTGVGIRFPQILSGTTSEDAVKIIMHAVLTEREMVAFPRSIYFIHCLSTIFPIKTAKLIYKFLGVYESFAAFTPTRKYQMES